MGDIRRASWFGAAWWNRKGLQLPFFNVLSFHGFPHESATFITKCTKFCVPRFTTSFWFGAKIRWIGWFWRIWCFHMTRCFHMTPYFHFFSQYNSRTYLRAYRVTIRVSEKGAIRKESALGYVGEVTRDSAEKLRFKRSFSQAWSLFFFLCESLE